MLTSPSQKDADFLPVGRAALKLAGAAQAFSYSFQGKVVLDIGSSTGGFTQYALHHGASKVIAIEKGTNQMKPPLRFHPKLDLREKTDIFTVHRSNLDAIDVILADVSFVSLTKILNYAKINLACSHTDFLVMLKPQFEANPRDLIRGVVKNETIRRQIIKDFEAWLKFHGFLILKKHDNLLAGKSGNRERFYLLRSA